jgi:hypothetical protein
MYGGGAAALKPLAWSRFAGQLPASERGNPLLAYYKRMLSSDAAERQAAVSGTVLVCVLCSCVASLLVEAWRELAACLCCVACGVMSWVCCCT